MKRKINDNLKKELNKINKKYKDGKIPNSIIAHLIKEISLREVQVGGPYKNNAGLIDVSLNKQIFLFLKKINVNLPELIFFLQIKTKKKKTTIKNAPVLKKEIENILNLIPDIAPGLSQKAKKYLTEAIIKTAKGNADGQMFLMPHFFYTSTKQSNKNITKNFLNQLGLMNAFFWTSFIIYDDFWDQDEAAKPELLPLANTMSRYFFSFFNDIFSLDKKYHSFFKESLDKLDNSNFFEITQCRTRQPIDFSDMSLKFYPCIGHVFGPLAIMLKNGHDFNSTETQETILFFKNYLIARQISDDMHDIEEDWKRGHLSLAVNELLLSAKNKNIDKFEKRNNLFWTKTIDKLCNKTFSLLKECRRSLENNKSLKNEAILKKLCDNLEKSAKDALLERDKRLELTRALLSS